ncbi:MAG: hypothetical protein ISS77_02185 [Phycisphaerae bacterium]|nr:hypothetical protein [Phycisphaerae bacterium]
MAIEYSLETCKNLQGKFEQLGLSRPLRLGRYEPGDVIEYQLLGISDRVSAKATLQIEKFVGGGFAGQVYKVKLNNIDSAVTGLEIGKSYAIKILIPPSRFSKLFRDVLYWIGFQGPFQLQVNPTAGRAGALWQKFIRRAAKLKFGSDLAVVDIYATFIDERLGSCGEISEWVEGRSWKLEVDENMDTLKRWLKKKTYDPEKLGSVEYREKKEFMRDFVNLLHEVGAPEFARQYEWSTCKSQPNCLKRIGEQQNQNKLTAVDFRAGLALLPFLPMSPGDFMLIIKGILRGSLVQFDRGSLNKLRSFIQTHREAFADMDDMLGELQTDEEIYRNSLPDITHNHFKLLYSCKLWRTIFDSAIVSWQVRNLADDNRLERFKKSKLLTLVFFMLGLVPFVGAFLRKLWCKADWRNHYGKIVTSPRYFVCAIKGKMAEKAIALHRAGRVSSEKAEKIANSFPSFCIHSLLSLLPFVFLHKMLTDPNYAVSCLWYICVRPVKLYFNEQMRRDWLMGMVAEGKKKHILSDEDAQTVLSQLDEPYIQKYLKSLAVHVCTLPVTQIVSFLVAWIYYVTHPELTKAQAGVAVGIILLAFQITPISPGSLCRGLYVVYLVIKERNFKDYNIAVFLGFFKYVGYLAFPIQMTYRYPAMARFMASHWATDAVHIVPVFGEHGALLEHWVFRLFYNWPLTIRRRMQKTAKIRAEQKPRYWHVPLISAVCGVLTALVTITWVKNHNLLPTTAQMWWLILLVGIFTGNWTTTFAAGATLTKRIIASCLSGFMGGIIWAAAIVYLGFKSGSQTMNIVETACFAPFFVILTAAISAVITEVKIPDPDLK